MMNFIKIEYYFHFFVNFKFTHLHTAVLYFKMRETFVRARLQSDFTHEKSVIQQENYFHFKLLVTIFRNTWHLCPRNM